MNILAFGPHPDDIEFGCAPVLIQEAAAGHRVQLLICSKGEAASSGTPEERIEEARQAARLIGAPVGFLELGGDCRIEYNAPNRLLMTAQIRRFQPQVVLAPLTEENQHPDHVAVGRLVRDAARLARYGGLEGVELSKNELPPHSIGHLYYYSITQPFKEGPPDVVIDVSPVKEKWEAAMACHRSQMRTRNYPDLVLARARTLGASIGVEYAVGLWSNDPLRLNSLADIPLSSRYF
jgi:LmbE family N-acetylglucosaminyl deacetylase